MLLILYYMINSFRILDKFTMPRVLQKAERSLKELCLVNIIRNIDSYWYKDFLDKYFGNTHFMYILGAFDDLPPKLIHDLWLCLKTRKVLRKHHAYILISPYFSELDLSHTDSDLALMISLAVQRCFQLHSLNLSHNKLPKDVILRSLPLLTQLTSLSLAYSNVTDQQVGNIIV